MTEVEWELFEESIEHGYPDLANWLEFLSSDEAPKGGTGSTFVDGIGDLESFKGQYAATALLGPVAPTAGDLDGDGTIGSADLLVLLADWGEVHSSADIDCDGRVDVDDVLTLIRNWG